MKKIFTLLAVSFLAATSFAQDLGLGQVAADDQILRGLDYNFYFNLENYDVVDYPADSSIVAAITVDGNLANITSYSFGANFPAGATSNALLFGLPSTYTDTISSTNDSITLCLVLSPANDTNLVNNGVCLNAAWNSAPTIDLGGSAVEAYSNNALIPSMLASGETPVIDSLRATITNYGDDFPFGSSVNYNVNLGSATTGAISGTNLTYTFTQGGTSTRVITNPSLLGSLVFPGSGTIDLCVTTNMTNDSDNNNDSFCSTFEYSTGVEDLAGANNSLSAYFSNEVLNLNVVSTEVGKTRVAIVNVAGQEVEASSVNLLGNESVENFQVQTTGLASGVYFVKVNDQVVKVFK